jgi:hypothetical protein
MEKSYRASVIDADFIAENYVPIWDKVKPWDEWQP